MNKKKNENFLNKKKNREENISREINQNQENNTKDKKAKQDAKNLKITDLFPKLPCKDKNFINSSSKNFVSYREDIIEEEKIEKMSDSSKKKNEKIADNDNFEIDLGFGKLDQSLEIIKNENYLLDLENHKITQIENEKVKINKSIIEKNEIIGLIGEKNNLNRKPIIKIIENGKTYIDFRKENSNLYKKSSDCLEIHLVKNIEKHEIDLIKKEPLEKKDSKKRDKNNKEISKEKASSSKKKDDKKFHKKSDKNTESINLKKNIEPSKKNNFQEYFSKFFKTILNAQLDFFQYIHYENEINSSFFHLNDKSNLHKDEINSSKLITLEKHDKTRKFIFSKSYNNGYDIIFDDFDFEKGFVSDYGKLDNNIIFTSIIYNRKIEKILITVKLFNKISKVEFELEQIHYENIVYLPLKKEGLINFNIKLVEDSSLILVSINHENYLFFYDIEQVIHSQGNTNKSHVYLIDSFEVKNHINKVDFLLRENNMLELIGSDYDYKIFHYRILINYQFLENCLSYTNSKNQVIYSKERNLSFNNTKIEFRLTIIKLISVYEKFFTSLITDLKFLRFKNNTYPINHQGKENPNKIQNKKELDKTPEKIYDNCSFSLNKDFGFIGSNNLNDDLINIFDSNCKSAYFCVASRDGFFKIFSLNINRREIYKYKSSELWITTINYNLQDKIFFLTVNTPEKILGIKFFNDRDTLVKRIPMSENSISCFYEDYEDKLYYLNYYNSIHSIKSSHFITLFKNYKTRCRKNYTVDKVFECINSNLNKVKKNNKNVENEKHNENLDELNHLKINNFHQIVLNEEIFLTEFEDKIFHFKKFKFLHENNDFDVFIMNRINRCSIYYK